MKAIRCFIAIEMSTCIQESLAALQESYSSQVPSGAVRWVAPKNIHLTLKFLGDTDVNDVDRIGDCLEDIAIHISPFTLQLGELGCFPNPRKPRVIWVGIEGQVEPLMSLQHQVEQELAGLGWPAEDRRFHPHLTLGRVKGSQQVVQARYPWGKVVGTGEQEVGEICLIESDLRPTGAVYTVRRRARLVTARTTDSA